MSFTHEKYLKLSPDNRLKKLIYNLKDYFTGQKDRIIIEELLRWYNQSEQAQIILPESPDEQDRLINQLMGKLKSLNPYLEPEPFDQKNLTIKTIPVKIVIDNLRSPFNIGSVLRTAHAFGVDECLICGSSTTSVLNPKVKKTARGAPIKESYFQTTLAAVNDLKKQGYTVYALEQTPNSYEIRTVKTIYPFALVVGNEEFGVDAAVLKAVDQIVHIEMLGIKKSINVSVAFGIALFELTRDKSVLR